MEIFDILFNWKVAASHGIDILLYSIMATVGTGFFVVRLLLSLLGGDVDADTDFDIDFVDDGFSFFSTLSVLAFFMGAGWMGLAGRVDHGLNAAQAAIAAGGFGLLLMVLAAGVLHLLRDLNHSVAYDLKTAVGHIGRVYMTIPASGEGSGQVEIDVSGRRKVLAAESVSDEMAAFTDVRVISVLENGTLLVDSADR